MKKNQIGLTFGRDDHRGSVLSPVTGTVLALNYKIREHPGIFHEDPYYEGRLYILEPDMPKKKLKGALLWQGEYAVDRSREPKTIEFHGTGIRTPISYR